MKGKNASNEIVSPRHDRDTERMQSIIIIITIIIEVCIMSTLVYIPVQMGKIPQVTNPI